MPVKIAPSLLAADFACLERDIAAIDGHADWLHLDVMDGHFVSNISFGIPVIESIRPLTNLYFDCHVMTTNPGAYMSELAKIGVDLVTAHIEAVPDPTDTMSRADDNGLDFGLVLKPETPFATVTPYVERCTVILVMSVEPGRGGQAFMPEVLPKVEEAREFVESHRLGADIQIDGGINPNTARQAISAGATVLVAGTAVFGSGEPAAAIESLRRATELDE